MPSRSDGKGGLSEAAIARIAGVERSRRRAWAEKGLLRIAGRKGYGELDACEAAVFRRLAAELEFDRAREAWRGIREALRDALLPGGSLLVAFDEGRATGSLHTDAGDLGAAVARPGRYAIVDVSSAVADARTGFRNAVAALEAKRHTVRPDVRDLRQ
jgi:hypothetical protein